MPWTVVRGKEPGQHGAEFFPERDKPHKCARVADKRWSRPRHADVSASRHSRRLRKQGETADKPGSVGAGPNTARAMAAIPLGRGSPHGSSHLPASSAEQASDACLFGVAPDGGCRVSPLGPPRSLRCTVLRRAEDSSLWPCSSPLRAGALPRIPLFGARTFLHACAQRLPGRLPLTFYPRRQVPRAHLPVAGVALGSLR